MKKKIMNNQWKHLRESYKNRGLYLKEKLQQSLKTKTMKCKWKHISKIYKYRWIEGK